MTYEGPYDSRICVHDPKHSHDQECDLRAVAFTLRDERDSLATQLEQMRRDLADLRARGVVPDADCTCGSGGHPRPCAKHPHRMEMHAREIDAENALEQMRRERDARPPLTRDDVIMLINVLSDDIVQPDLGWFGDIVDRLHAFVGGAK